MLKLKKLLLITSIITMVTVVTPIVASASAFMESSSITLDEASDQQTEQVKKREDVPEEYKWKTEDLYATQEAWSKDFDTVNKEIIPQMEKLKGTLGSEDKVIECLGLNVKALNLLDKIYWYVKLKADENGADNDAAEVSDKAESLYNDYSSVTAFIQPELLKQPEDTLKSYINNPKFKDYAHLLDSVMKQKPHTLSEGEEKLLADSADIGGTAKDVFDKLRLADMKYPKIKGIDGQDIQLSDGVYSAAIDNQDRDYRKRAFEGVYGAYDGLKNSFAAALIGSVKNDVFLAKARNYNSALEASLAGDNIPTSVYTNLIKAVNDNNKYLHKYVDLRKEYLGVDKVHLYDMYVPLVNDYNVNITYEDAKKTIYEGLKPLGDEYITNVKKGFDNRWVDVYETENKNTGGYQIGIYGVHPFVLLNYNNSVDSMLTAAHEMGHAMNSVYSEANQPYINAEPPIFNAEVASTTNEILMLKYLINNAKTDDEKLYYINNRIEQIRGSVYTQVMYSEFEESIHDKVEKGEALSAKSLSLIWGDLMKKYYGDNFETEEVGNLWWARVPHFYNNFYVYKYATSMAASNEIAKNILDGKDPKAVDKYMDFLKSGNSNYPIEVLKKAGVDATQTTSVDNVLKEFGDLVDQMEQILIKQGKIPQ